MAPEETTKNNRLVMIRGIAIHFTLVYFEYYVSLIVFEDTTCADFRGTDQIKSGSH